MAGKTIAKKAKQPARNGELYYATHYHLVPLYVFIGLLLITVLVMGCFLRYLWVQQQNTHFFEMAQMSTQSTSDVYLAATENPTDRKQYIAPASVRFTAGTNPYEQLRYAYDPGSSNDKNGASIGITTSGLLSLLEIQALSLNTTDPNTLNQLQLCSRMYVLRFEPGATQYGGFTPFAQIKLKDGRTAYLHKNTNCLTDSSGNQTDTGQLETLLKTVESY